MNSWSPVITAQFPELGTAPYSWDAIGVSANFARMLEQATHQSDLRMVRRILQFVLWLSDQSKDEEQLIYICQDILRNTVTSPPLRAVLTSVLNARSFGANQWLRRVPLFKASSRRDGGSSRAAQTWRLTLRSSGHAAACHAWPSFHSGPCVPCRCVPLTSNVRRHKTHHSCLTCRTPNTISPSDSVYGG